jgi:Fur family ferric uptake transcriptional regulator
MSDSDVRLQRFADFLARSGLKTTRQRERIVRAFFAADRHLSAEELYHRIQAERPGIGLVTVYRTLKLLREAGLATERQFGESYTRFDPNPADRPHDHLICTRCGKIQEFEDPTLYSLQDKVARSLGFTVTEHKLELYGLCRECTRLSKGRAVRSGRPTRPAPVRT